MPSASLRLAVVGAGAAGLVAARELRREGHAPVVFERAAAVGGTWLYTPPATSSDPLGAAATHSSLYASLRTNLPRETMGFLDFPFAAGAAAAGSPRDPRRFPGHEEVLRYLEAFARRFDLLRLVRFETEVLSVRREDGGGGRWAVTSRKLGEKGSGQEEFYDAVVVCNGHYTEPRIAVIPGVDAWPGKQMHSHNYRVPEPFLDQVVIVIGASASAFDISRDIASMAEEVHIADRSAPASTCKKEPGYDNLWLHSMIDHAQEDGTVVFQDGSSIKADVIMHCTGYLYDFPFLGDDSTITVDDNRVDPLYKHIFPPEVAPHLSFIGLPWKVIPFPLFELQSKWVARVLSGRASLCLSLPPPSCCIQTLTLNPSPTNLRPLSPPRLIWPPTSDSPRWPDSIDVGERAPRPHHGCGVTGCGRQAQQASMALGDLMASRLGHSSTSPSPSPAAAATPVPPLPHQQHQNHHNHVADDLPVANGPEPRNGLEVAEVEKPAPVAYLPQVVVLCEQRHQGIDEATAAAAAPSTSGLVSKWRPKDRMKTGCVALVLCLNISVDPPDVIKISPCARMECWIDPFSMLAPKALESIGKTLHSQYERWQPKARYKLQLDPTVEEVKKLCNTCRKYARSERVLFHYNGHGVPKPTSNGEIWVFNKSYTQYIPLPITDLDSWLKTPSIYVFDCSAAGIIVKAFLERLDWSSTSSASSQKDCILLAACEAHQMLPQSAEFPADVFTACLTTPIKMALHWFCKRTLLHGSLDHSLIDQIPGRQNDRKTLLGELNWIFTAITDTIAWNVLPHGLFQRLFRQDLLVASLFRNFLLAERIMRSANCSPVSYPMLPPTHQHHMWDAWDMAAEICLSKLPQLIADPNAEFQPSPFFTEQLMAFEVWLDHGSEDKKPPEQLPIVLQVLLSQSHRFRALVLLGRFLDMGPWAVDLALSVGIFPYVLKLLQTSAMELRQILVFIWTKILSLDKSCQVDLVKDGGHGYFIRFLDSLDAFPEQRAMAAFVIAVIVDGHRTGQEACMNAGLIDVCLRHLQPENPHAQTEPLLLQWLCLCLGKVWEDFPEAQLHGLQTNAPEIVICLLSEPQPEVRAAAVFALGTLLDTTSNGADDDSDDDEKVKAEINIVRSLLQISSDASPLVRSEVAIALTRFALGHNKHLKSVAAEYWKPQSNSLLKSLPSLANISNPSNVYSPNNILQGSIGPVLRVGSDSSAAGRDGRISTSSPIATSSIMHGSPQSDDSSQHSDSGILLRENASNGGLGYTRSRPVDNVIYSQFISTMCSFAKDPYPRIATIGRRALSLIGVEQVVMKNTRFNSGGAHRGETSASNFGMARSSSWLDMNSGSNLIKFRTPPVSPPQHDYLPGLRRVCSMEFGQHPINSPDGLADPLLSSAAAPSNAELSILPQSTIYNWSCGHFSRPLLTGSDDNEEANARREERERVALDYIAKCQRSSCKMTSQIASWDTRFELGTKAALLLPFSPIVVAADENEQIRVWNYDDALPVNSYQNHNLSDRGLSKLLLINELDESLLLAASSDGNVRVWKNFAQKGGQKLVTAFSSVQGHRAAGRSIVIDWQQQSGYLYASGDMSSIFVWDLDKEQLLSTIQSSGDSAISSLTASQVCSGHFAAGFADGSVRIYDVRSTDRVVYMARPHSPRTEKVVGIGFQPGFDPYKIVSASQAGDIQFLDVRRAAEPYLTIEAHRGSLTALAVHRHAPIVASGSAKQMIKVFSLEGEQLTIIRYQPSFMGQRIGSVNCLSFHPYKSLLAAGAGDNALVSIYAEENYK